MCVKINAQMSSALTTFDILAQNLLISFLKNISTTIGATENYSQTSSIVVDKVKNNNLVSSINNKLSENISSSFSSHNYVPYDSGLSSTAAAAFTTIAAVVVIVHPSSISASFSSPSKPKESPPPMLPAAAAFLRAAINGSTNDYDDDGGGGGGGNGAGVGGRIIGDDYNDGFPDLSGIDYLKPSNNNDETTDATVDRLYLGHFIIGIILAIIILSTVIGNLLVIAAILFERHLRSVGNYLVFSLAVADLMVACLVMPFGAIYVVTGKWTLGANLCDLWTVADVLCCTASILHLLAIALDRFWAVTNVDYIHQRRNGRRIGLMIFLIWFVSLIISVAPILGWRDEEFHDRIEKKQCLISQDVTYQIFATCASFYVPLLLILILYWRIFQVARKRIRHKPGNKVSLVAMKKNNNDTNVATVACATDISSRLSSSANNKNDTGSPSGHHYHRPKNLGRRLLFAKKLVKYSAPEYLQENQRPTSDIVSHNVDICHDGESNENDDSDLANVAGGKNLGTSGTGGLTVCIQTDQFDIDDDDVHSWTSTPTMDKKLSIISTAKTTTTTTTNTTHMTLTSYDSCTGNDISPAAHEPSPSNRSPIGTTGNCCSVIVEESSTATTTSSTSTATNCCNSSTQPLIVKSSTSTAWPPQQQPPPSRHQVIDPIESQITSAICNNDANNKTAHIIHHHHHHDPNSSTVLQPSENNNCSFEIDLSNLSAVADADSKIIITDKKEIKSTNAVSNNNDVDSSISGTDMNNVRFCHSKESFSCSTSHDDAADVAVPETTMVSSDALTNNNNNTVIANTNKYQEENCTKNDDDNDKKDLVSMAINGNDIVAINNNDHDDDVNKKTLNGNDPSKPTIQSSSTSEYERTIIVTNNNNNRTGSNHHYPQQHHHQHSKMTSIPATPVSVTSGPTTAAQVKLHQKESVESKRERKAAKTLAIITGVFVICWLPFFINALLSPLNKTYQDLVPAFVTDFFLWLGYINSCVNPIIYTIFSPDFRAAFKKMLLGKKSMRTLAGGSGGAGGKWRFGAGKVARV